MVNTSSGLDSGSKLYDTPLEANGWSGSIATIWFTICSGEVKDMVCIFVSSHGNCKWNPIDSIKLCIQ